MKTFLLAKQQLGEILSSCEMIDAQSLECSTKPFNHPSPIPEYPFYMLIETSGSRVEHDEEKLHDFLNNSMESGIVLDGTTTNESRKMRVNLLNDFRLSDDFLRFEYLQDIWQLRERIAPGILYDGFCFKYDVSVPLKHFYDIIPAMKKRVGSLATKVCGYGHIGKFLRFFFQC